MTKRKIVEGGVASPLFQVEAKFSGTVESQNVAELGEVVQTFLESMGDIAMKGANISLLVSAQSNDALKLHTGDLKKYRFTRREIEIVDLIPTDKTNKEIGELMGITEHTVKYHISNILEKTGCKNRRELTYKLFNRPAD
ncbi:helix-turn-helix transcriptional regulator [Candidatus Saccharibacteria bacterium]|nr:helix-turn-helix transcriptional regulator [Candidatus Saccharibacteria bacterium]